MSVRILEGDCREVLATLPDESVQCVVTSPPYFGLRCYGHDKQLGLEPTPELYVQELVGVFREVRRVLRSDGVCWLNLGDSYATSGVKSTGRNDGDGEYRLRTGGRAGLAHDYAAKQKRSTVEIRSGLKSKDLIGVPWRVAFALQADGWYLRSDVIWAKPNPMPESVTDRPTKAHEYLFLLSKSASYYYDATAIYENATTSLTVVDKAKGGAYSNATDWTEPDPWGSVGYSGDGSKRNRRTVWTIATSPFPGAHFAVMPPKLVEPCILAGTKRDDTVLDPFAGAGTVGLVASRLGRSFIGIELNPEYAKMARARIHDDAPLFAGDAA